METVRKLVQESIESFKERIVPEIEFSFEWNRLEKEGRNTIVITVGEDKGEHGNDKLGFHKKTDFGIHWICFFYNTIKKTLNNPKVTGKKKEAIDLICLHEVLHALDYMKNGDNTFTEREINKLATYYLKNKHLPITV